jgi:hypothetical protein
MWESFMLPAKCYRLMKEPRYCKRLTMSYTDRINRRTFAARALAPLLASRAALGTVTRPNILFIMTDDHSSQALGLAGRSIRRRIWNRIQRRACGWIGWSRTDLYAEPCGDSDGEVT